MSTKNLSGGLIEFQGGNLVMELYPIQQGVVVLLVALCMETRISSGLGGWGHLAQVQVSPFMNLQVSGSL